MAYRSKVHDLSRGKWLRMGLCAESGFGKTVFAGTAPNGMFITTDPEGSQSAYEFNSDAQEIICNTEEDLQNAYLDLDGGMIKDLGLEFVMVDDLTTVQYIFMRESIDNRIIAKAAKDRKDLAFDLHSVFGLLPGNELGNRYVPEQNDRYTYQNATIDFVKWMTMLPVHIIFLAKRASAWDGEGDEHFTMAIEGQRGAVAAQCMGYMKVIGFGEVKTPQGGGDPIRRMYFEHWKKYRGKDRYAGREGKLGRYRDNLDVPTMMRILGIQSGEGVASRPTRRPVKQRPVRRTVAAR